MKEIVSRDINDKPEQLPIGAEATSGTALNNVNPISTWVSPQTVDIAPEGSRCWGDDLAQGTDETRPTTNTATSSVKINLQANVDPHHNADPKHPSLHVPLQKAVEEPPTADMGGTPTDPPDTTRTSFEMPEPDDEHLPLPQMLQLRLD